jgi:hypothetical protein
MRRAALDVGSVFASPLTSLLSTCFSEHINEGRCEGSLFRIPLQKLTDAFKSGEHREIERFVCHDADGLGNPLPREACINLSLGVAYTKDIIPEYSRDLVIASDIVKRERRRQAQKRRRAAKKLGVAIGRDAPADSTRLAPYRASTIHFVSGALIVQHWTGGWHYREQMEILRIMGLSKGQDFIRDKVSYLQDKNQSLFDAIEGLARRVRSRRTG